MTKDQIVRGFMAAHCGSIPSDCVVYASELLSVCLTAFNYAEAIREFHSICWTSDLKSLSDRIVFLRTLLDEKEVQNKMED